MPTKTTKADQPYRVTGKVFVWDPLDDDDARGNLPSVTIPMRIKLKVIRQLAGQDLDNVATMFDILEQLIPGQTDRIDDMDVNDFTAMFTAWNTEYQSLSGATLGE